MKTAFRLSRYHLALYLRTSRFAMQAVALVLFVAVLYSTAPAEAVSDFTLTAVVLFFLMVWVGFGMADDPVMEQLLSLKAGSAARHHLGDVLFLLTVAAIFGGAAPLPLSLARVEADVTAAGCDGSAGGAIPEALLATGVSLAVNGAIEAAGCSPDVPCSDMLQGALDLFDANGDYRISADELTRNAMWSLAFNADVDTDGDGTKDAISVGCGFTCVGARFEPTPGS